MVGSVGSRASNSTPGLVDNEKSKKSGEEKFLKSVDSALNNRLKEIENDNKAAALQPQPNNGTISMSV